MDGRIILKIFLVTLLLFTGSSIARADSKQLTDTIYVGGQVGWSDTHYGKNTLGYDDAATSVTNKNFSGEVYMGYQINQHFAIEGGYYQFAETKLKNISDVSGADSTINQSALDLTGKFILPLSHGLSIYADGGAGYVDSQRSLNDKAKSETTASANDEYAWVPTAGFGASMNITRSLTIDASAQRFFGHGDIENTDYAGIGASFHFG